ncbi:MAG: restriction endonuclease subunit R [Flavobacteriales bacterium]|mgnify:FL=1|nr:restriction endonuclease subunit R [Flavobacteriales bacterium]|tara:strand:- start:2472 stop:2885 length:414 start_codon:yes stop_codon:yes gene_type:complete
MKLKIKNNKEYIFDLVRKKYVLNQPEEWVRQHIIQYLNTQKGYPISLMSVEKKTIVNKLIKRCDIICYNQMGKALLLVECKAPKVKLNTSYLNQSINYQRTIQAKYILITNGTTHFCFTLQDGAPKFIDKIPKYIND